MIKVQEPTFPGQQKSIWAPQLLSLSITTFLLSPFERSQTLLQIKDTYIDTQSPKNIKEFAKRIYSKQKLSSMWRGAFQNFIRQFAQFNLAYYLSTFYFQQKSNDPVSLSKYCIATNYLCNILTYPFEVIKNKYMVNMRQKYVESPYKNINSCIKQSYKYQGMKGIFGGLSIAVIHAALSLSLISPISSLLQKSFQTNDAAKLFGSFAIIQILLYPLDTIKKRLQLSGALQHNHKYNSFRKAVFNSPSQLFNGIIFRLAYIPLHLTIFGFLMNYYYNISDEILIPQDVMNDYIAKHAY